MRARLNIRLKPSVHDPAGAAVERSLGDLGHDAISAVRIGRVVELDVDAAGPAEAELAVAAAADELLANPIIESWDIEILDATAAAAPSGAGA